MSPWKRLRIGSARRSDVGLPSFKSDPRGICRRKRRDDPFRQPFGHSHKEQEEIYVLVSGGARVKLDDHIVELEPWDALSTWLRQFVSYAAAKRALAEELLAYIDADAAVFAQCRGAINAAGEPLLARAQRAGVVRTDTDFNDIGRMIGGIAGIRSTDPEQIERILELALDGLRYQPPRPEE